VREERLGEGEVESDAEVTLEAVGGAEVVAGKLRAQPLRKLDIVPDVEQALVMSMP
jgi:hypothetical protein